MKIFVQTKKLGPFFTLFWSKIWPFLLKNQDFGCFLENRLSEFHVIGQKLNCFQSVNGSVVSGKNVSWPFWPILGQEYIACGDKLRFLTIFNQFLPVCWCLFDNFWFLNQVYGLRRDKVSLGCDKKILVIFGPFLVQKLVIFIQKTGFRTVSSKLHIRFV